MLNWKQKKILDLLIDMGVVSVTEVLEEHQKGIVELTDMGDVPPTVDEMQEYITEKISQFSELN